MRIFTAPCGHGSEPGCPLIYRAATTGSGVKGTVMSWLSKLRNAFHPKQLDNDLSGIARIAGASFLFSLRNLFAVEKGFDARGVAVIDVSNELTRKEAQAVFLDQFQRRIAAPPGIQGATTAEWAILEESTNTDQVTLPGKPPSEKEPIFYRISPGYFATLRTPLLSGRDFEPRDRNVRGTGQPVPAIVNQAFAQRYFGDENPLGKTFQRAPVNHRIVGVAANAHYASLREGAEPIVYTPLEGGNYFALHVRSPLDLGSVVRMVEREATAMGSGTRVREVTTLDTLIGNTLLREKLLAGIGGVFAFLGLLLAAIGLFGLLNYSVTRTKEIGIRAALGARLRRWSSWS